MNINRNLRCLMTVVCLLCMTIASAQTKLVFTPQWTAQAQFAGYYVALSKGFYKDVGLDVTIKHPSLSKPVIGYLTSGESQLVSLQLMTALKEIDKGIALKNVLQTLQQNSVLIVSHKPIQSIESLRDKKVGCWKVGSGELPMAIDARYHLNIQWIPFISHINLYISKAIDATLVMSYSEYIQLELAGQRIKKNQILNLSDIGYDIPQDGLYCTADYYKKHKKAIDDFVKATQRGWEWAIANPEEALDIVMLNIRQTGIVSNMVIQERMMKTYFELMKDRKSGKRTYRLTPQAVSGANKLLLETGFIKHNITYQQITSQ